MKYNNWSILGLLLVVASHNSPLHAQGAQAQEAQEAQAAVTTASKYAAHIQKADLRRHLLVLTSDSLQGRETGEIGQKRAARYLANQFAQIGLAPVATLNDTLSYFQRFALHRVAWKKVRVQVAGKQYTHLSDMLYLSNNPNSYTGNFEVVFADKQSPALLQGKLLAYVAESTSEWQEKAALARKAGAIGAVVFVKGTTLKQEIANYIPYLKRRYSLANNVGKEQEFALVLPADAFVHFFGTKLGDIKKAKPMQGTIFFDAQISKQVVYTENVVGYLPGGDKKEELLVITAHYDHLGMHGSHIYRGADDNGTGTAALLEMAESFALAKSAGHGPARSILFMAITGEEKGLLGSDYYTQEPLFPLAQTVANLNIDMIGRIDEVHKKQGGNYVYLIGSDKLSSELHKLSEATNRRYTQLVLDYTFNDEDDPNRFYYRSDHYNFAKHGIPVIFYFSGVHEDYHKPTDTIEKLHFDKYHRIVELIFYTAWEVTHQKERPKVDNP